MLPNTIDKLDDIDTWIDQLDELGIDPDEVLTGLRDAQARLDKLQRFASTFRKNGQGMVDHVIARLALDPGEYEATIPQVLTAAMWRTDGVREEVGRILDRAMSTAAGDCIRAFRQSVPRLVEMVTETHARVIESARENAVDAGLVTLEAATRAGVGDQWLALEKAYAEHRAIGSLLTSWHSRKQADYAVAFRNKAAADAAPRAGADCVWFGLAVQAGADPAVVTNAERESLWEKYEAEHDAEAVHLAQHRARKAGEEAIKAAKLSNPEPKQRRLPGQTYRAS